MTQADQAVTPWSVETGEELRALYEFTEAIYHARSVDEVYSSALDVITKTLGCERASILLFDGAGRMQFVAWRGLSERYRTRLAGHTPWRMGDHDPPPIFVEDIEATVEPDWIKQEIRAEGIVSLGFVPLTLEGRVIGKFMTYYGHRRSFNRHAETLAITIARHLGFSIGRARAEASREAALSELRLSESRFRQMTDQAPIMIWMSNATGHCEHLNKVACDFWGVDQGQIDSFDWTGTIHPDDVGHVMQQMGSAVMAHEPVLLRGRYSNRQGEWRVLQTEARPRFSCDGRFLGMIGVNVDVTEQESIARQRELMFAELNHRVKNTLTVVQAIAHQTFKTEKTNPLVETFVGRLGVLAAAHDLLSKAHWESTPIRELVTQVLARDPANRGNVDADGPALLLAPKQALSIALALHELQTNALKYGALSVETGRVSLQWTAPADRQLSILWTESGGPPVTPPRRRGFGTMMIEQAIATDLNGTATIEFRPEGVLCRIEAFCERTHS
jgi:PAS domain S-box-containing protein